MYIRIEEEDAPALQAHIVGLGYPQPVYYHWLGVLLIENHVTEEDLTYLSLKFDLTPASHILVQLTDTFRNSLHNRPSDYSGFTDIANKVFRNN